MLSVTEGKLNCCYWCCLFSEDKWGTRFQGFSYFNSCFSLALNKCFKKGKRCSLSKELMSFSFIQRCVLSPLLFLKTGDKNWQREFYVCKVLRVFFKFFAKYIFYTLLPKGLPAGKYYLLISYLKCLMYYFMTLFCGVLLIQRYLPPKDITHDFTF